MYPLLYIVTDRAAAGERGLADVVKRALGGIGQARVALQVREKDLPTLELLALARELREVTAAAGARLFVNDRIDVALAVGADGVHLGGGSLAPADARAVAPALALAASTHNLDEVRRAQAAGAEFAVFGPIFDTPSKRALGTPLGLAALAEAAAIGLPLLAIGGVNLYNVSECLASGARGIACVRAVMAAPDPASATRDLLDVFRRC